MTWQITALKYYAIGTTALLLVAVLAAFRASRGAMTVDDLTVRRINVVDSTGRVRVILAGSFPPRRTNLAGLLFTNQDGGEAGGLVYRGHRSPDGRVSAAGTITMDQYKEDQVVVLQYDQDGLRKQQGLVVSDRPDTLGPALRNLYRVLDTFPSGPRRDSVQRALLAQVPTEQLPARRVFVGRDTTDAAVLNLSDRRGNPRIRLIVDSLGTGSIVFLDSHGQIVRKIDGAH
ncbi:MAG TPA: hypothetical protein VE110_10340 [Gemmatimonadaceae bacterium]|nr:hypothetical protein [Gemmatimonadaceae bacterium]